MQIREYKQRRSCLLYTSALDRVEFKDIELIYAIMAKYVLGGMTKGMLWSEAVENGTFLKCLQKLKEVLNVWDAPLP